MKFLRRTSFLHLQIGQETIYLLLTAGIFSSLLLTAYVVRLKAPVEQPPIVTLREADGYFFAPGSPLLSPKFEQELRTGILPKVKSIADEYDARIIEVIGHTDELPVSYRHRRGSDLDATLLPWMVGQSTKQPIPFDNVGLGMARAVAVARVLRAAGLRSGYAVIPMSAGPFVLPGDKLTDGKNVTDARERRRIEIRLRRAS